MAWRARALGVIGLSWAAVAACSNFEGAPSADDVDSGSALDAGDDVVQDLDAADAADDDGGSIDDTCDLAKAVCPSVPPNLVEGGGLVPISRCAFALEASTELLAGDPRVTALEQQLASADKKERLRTFSAMMADAKDTIVTTTSDEPVASLAGIQEGFKWGAGNQTTTWLPRGVTIADSANAASIVNGQRIWAVSWADSDVNQRRGSRVTFVDLTRPEASRSRSAVLVEPIRTKDNPDWQRIEGTGGLVWYGNYLYVADSTKGLRVFDLTHILRADSADDSNGPVSCSSDRCIAAGTQYALPQVGSYQIRSAFGCAPLFSSIALDLSTDPPAIVSSESCTNDAACATALAGRVFRWPLDPRTGLLKGTVTFPSEAYFMGQRRVRGAVSKNGVHYFSSEDEAMGSGRLIRAVPGKASVSSPWIATPQGVAVDPTKGNLLGMSGQPSARYVFGVSLASYPAP